MARDSLPVLLAVAGYVFTYWHTRVNSQRLKRIERVSDQIKLLYGPLLATVTASKKAFEAMIRQNSPDGRMETFIQRVSMDPHGREADAYRLWMREVLQPLNEQAANALFENADLLETDEVEPLLLQLIAHMSANKVILKSWEQGGTDMGKLPITYPDALLTYIKAEYSRLKTIQAKLLGFPRHPSSKL
eukprot:jgi/Tetstr1/425263/TSEL_015716.t1